MAGKSSIETRNTVVFTTLASFRSAAASTAARLASAREVCDPTPPSTSSPVSGSRGIWPEQNTRSPERTACEYGPMAAGALVVAMTRRSLNRDPSNADASDLDPEDGPQVGEDLRRMHLDVLHLVRLADRTFGVDEVGDTPGEA